MSDDAILQARRWFAEELRFITRAGVRDLIDITRRARSITRTRLARLRVLP